MKILCVGASMALPRDGVLYEHTWYYKLKHHFAQHEFYQDFVRARISDTLIADRRQDPMQFRPDVVVLQIGSTECAPRIINNRKFIWKLLITLSNMFHVQDLFWKTVKKHYKRTPDTVYVPINRFQRNIETYIQYLIDEYHIQKVIIVEIAKVSAILRKRNPYWNSNIDIYNAIYENISKSNSEKIICLNPLFDLDETMYVEDGIHLNESGNDKVYGDLARVINTI